MSPSVTTSEETRVFSLNLTSNPESSGPLLCQILKALCYSPVCCSVSQGLKRLQAKTQSALGTMQIMVGLLNIGLGAIVVNNHSWTLRWLRVPYWLSAVFIAVGVICILAEKYPSPCLVGINVLINLAGAAFAITGIVFYAIDLGPDKLSYWYYNDSILDEKHSEEILERYKGIKYIEMMLLVGLDIVLIVLAVLQLCVTISAAVLSVKALCKYQEQNEEVEYYEPLLEIPTTKPDA